MTEKNWQKLFSSYSYFVEFYTEDKNYIARCMEFPALRVVGSSKEEAIKNLQEGLIGGLEKYEKANGSLPSPIVKESHYEGPYIREVVRKGLSQPEAKPQE